MYAFLADVVVLIHAAFVIFAALGGFLVLYRPGWMWLHVPAAIWAALVELMGWVCPLTPLENRFRAMAGVTPYGSGFIEHYVMPVLYPEMLTRRHEILLGLFVLTLNLVLYAWAFSRRHSQKSS